MTLQKLINVLQSVCNEDTKNLKVSCDRKDQISWINIHKNAAIKNSFIISGLQEDEVMIDNMVTRQFDVLIHKNKINDN